MKPSETISLSFFVDKDGIKQALSLSESSLRDLRDKGEWKENIHFVYFNPTHHRAGTRYNLAMCLNWMATRGRPDLHQKAIEAYWETLEEGHAAQHLGSIKAVTVSALESQKIA